MNLDLMNARDRRLVAAVVVLIAVSGAYVYSQHNRAFPQASLHLTLTKAEITHKAEVFLDGMKLKPADFRQLTVFSPDDDARIYLERELGLETANQLMERQVAVWNWRARWFNPPKQDEVTVWLSPEGRITGLDTVIPEDRAGARPTRAEALATAQQFLAQMGVPAGRLIEDRLEQRPNRDDYEFTWEQDGFKAKDATYRRTVTVKGGSVGKYREFLYVPEAWTRDFASMRSRNEVLADIAQALWVPLALAALLLLVRELRRHTIPWRAVLILSGAVGGLTIASQLNLIPLAIDAFPTSSPFAQTLLLVVFEALGAGTGVIIYLLIPAAAGEPTYRGATRDRLGLVGLLQREGLASREFFRATLVGYAFAACHLAFVVAFYIIGRRLGAWSPQDVEYSNLLSTALPFIFPIATAAMAAFGEEFWFRLLAVPLVARYVPRVLAMVIPAFVWGFLHANYPQQPAYIRGVEVGVIGVVAGLIMWRFGIAATLVWHFTVDAALMGMFLFSSPSWYYRLNGLVVVAAILAPIAASLFLYVKHGGFVVLPEPEIAEEQRAAESAEVTDPPLAPRWPARWLYAAAGLAAAIGLVCMPRVVGDWIRVDRTAAAAEAAARASVPEARTWRAVTDFHANLDDAEFEFLRREVGYERAQQFIAANRTTGVWLVRLFQPQSELEWRVAVGVGGKVTARYHNIAERDAGARLSADEARKLASAATGRDGLTVAESNEQKRANRTDWSFVFEDPAARVGEARARSAVEIHGDVVSGPRRFIKIPEQWLREFRKPALRSFAIPAFFGSLLMPLVVLFVRRLGAHETVFHWSVYNGVAAAMFVLAALSALNQYAVALVGYDTATPLSNYLTSYLLGRAMVVLLATGAAFGLVLALDVFRQAALGRAQLNRPSIANAVAVAMLWGGLSNVVRWFVQRVPGPRPGNTLWGLAGVDNYVPGFAVLFQALSTGVYAVAIAGIIGFAMLRYMSPRRRIQVAALGVAAVAISQSMSASLFAANLVADALWIAAAVLVALTLSADLISIGCGLMWATALRLSIAYVRQPEPWLRVNGVIAAAAAIALGIAVLWAAAPSAERPPQNECASE